MRDTSYKSQFIVSRVQTEPKDLASSGFAVHWKINPHMQPGKTSLAKATRQHSDFVQALEDCGGQAHAVSFLPKAYDSVFMKDNAVLVHDGDRRRAFLARPKTAERSLEPLARAGQLKSFGFEITGPCRNHFEGGDLVVSPNGHFACFGHGFRSSAQALPEIENFLKIPMLSVKLIDPYFYHLDTAFNIVQSRSEMIAFAYRGAFDKDGWQALSTSPYIDRILEIEREEALRFALNWVEIEGTIILGGHVPNTTVALESLGKNVVVINLNQFRMAGGSAACLVAKVHHLERRDH